MIDPTLGSRLSSGVRSAGVLRRAALGAAAVMMLLAGSQGFTAAGARQASDSAARPLKLLFLGDEDGTHQSPGLFTSLAPVLARHGIQLTHVSSPATALSAPLLADYDALLIYGDHATITPAQEKALEALQAAIDQATAAGFLGQAFSARLAQGEVELNAGKKAEGEAHLTALEREAGERGFQVIVGRIQTIRK